MRLFKWGDRQLSVSWPALLAVVVCLPILLRLGFWQLERAEYKQQLLRDLETAESVPASTIERLGQLATLRPNARVILKGNFLPGRTTLLDNRYYRGRAGFNVVSLFRLKATEEAMLVNRGWLPLGQYRYPLPEVETPLGEVELAAEIRPVPTDTVVLQEEVFDHWPELIQSVDLKQLSRLSGYELPTAWALASADSDESLKQEWPVTIVGPERHHGYAVQWFGLAIVFLGVMIVAGFKKTGDTQGD